MHTIQISSIAKNYANALIKLAEDNVVSYDEILKNLETIKEICENSEDLCRIFNNPAISNEIKYSIIDSVFIKDINPKLINFTKILVEKGIFNEIAGITKAYNNELDKINKIQRVIVTSAIPLDEDTKQRITEKLQIREQKNIIADWQIDEDIIGGLVVQIDDNVIDSSLKNKIENLSKNIIK